MKIVVSGGTGFIGTPLVRRLGESGHDVLVLTRDPGGVKAGRPLPWAPPAPGAWTEEAGSADAIVNLAGANIGEGRWTDERKRQLISSRLDATNALVAAMRARPGARTFVSASAVGYYGLRDDEELDESATKGGGFLADLSAQWEEAARAAEDTARVVITRFGVVLDPAGGALAKMLPPFRLGAGGPIGTGRQWMSWIVRDDAVRAVEWALQTENASGVYNVTAPVPVRNRDFTRALGRALHRPAFLPLPALPLRILFGQMADEVLLGGQRVLPSRLESDGFEFRERAVEGALTGLLRG